MSGARSGALLVLAGLLTAGPVSAQAIRPNGSADPQTIVVTGRGVVRVPADRMRIEIHFFNRGNVIIRPTGAPAPVATPAPVTGVDYDAAGKRIAEILRAHGIPDARWVLPVLGPLSPQSTSPAIIGTIAKPTREKVESILRDAFAAMPDSLSWMGSNFQVQTVLIIDDCAAAEARAQQAAIADARDRAAAIAQAAGVGLGAVIGVAEPGTQNGSCRTRPDDIGMFAGNGYAVSQYDTNLDVPLLVNATVTFAIK